MTANGNEVGCTDTLTGLGPEGKHSIGLSDLRFYVSNIRFTDADGQSVALTLDRNDFQYTSGAGSVALVDLTGNAEGTCGDSGVAFAEGTARTNTVITGKTVVEHVASVAFDIGVPQAVMKETIANNTLEGAPSPLNEMYWSWATGYRHFVMNFTVDDGNGHAGDGYVHIGSRDCGPADGLALEDRASCDFVNTPAVLLSTFDLATDTVRVELPPLLGGLDFISPIYDTTTFEVIGEGTGVECHSSPMQPDCPSIFSRFGLDMPTGRADAKANELFSRK
ncbi:Hypothetical protein A7982_00075 [Minicystis rosea]|nr:Hypothetical protein A7982_00075 [Minicystis rosea]